MHFGRGFHFFYPGAVPAMIKVRVCKIALKTSSPWGSSISCLGSLGVTGTAFSPGKPSLRELWTASIGVGVELGAKEEEGEHVEQINMSSGRKATRAMTRLMSAV